MNTNTRDRIERYIKNTKLNPKITDGYCLYCTEVLALYEELGKDLFGMIGVIFEYGRAKGYRAAKAEARNGQAD